MAEKEYIERGALFEAVRDKSMTQFDWSEKVDLEEFEEVLNNIPAADVVEVRHGEWIEHIEKLSWLEDDVEAFYNCSECGSSHWSIVGIAIFATTTFSSNSPLSKIFFKCRLIPDLFIANKSAIAFWVSQMVSSLTSASTDIFSFSALYNKNLNSLSI